MRNDSRWVTWKSWCDFISILRLNVTWLNGESSPWSLSCLVWDKWVGWQKKCSTWPYSRANNLSHLLSHVRYLSKQQQQLDVSPATHKTQNLSLWWIKNIKMGIMLCTDRKFMLIHMEPFSFFSSFFVLFCSVFYISLQRQYNKQQAMPGPQPSPENVIDFMTFSQEWFYEHFRVYLTGSFCGL